METRYQVVVVNMFGDAYWRTAKSREHVETLWNEANGAAHILFAAVFEGDTRVKHYVAERLK